MNNLIVFAFKNTVSETISLSLKRKNTFLLNSDRASVESFVEQLGKMQPEYILGLGEYQGRDNSKIRIETRCNNKFRNDILGDTLHTLAINPFLKISNSKSGERMGNSYCNLISYLIVSEIKSGKLQSKYCFIHVPKSINIHMAIDEVKRAVDSVNY